MGPRGVGLRPGRESPGWEVAVNIGRPTRIFEIEPTSIPIPETMPLEPAPAPAEAPPVAPATVPADPPA